MVDSFYREYIIDHFRHPRNFGKLDNPDYSFKEYNSLCGDLILIMLKTKKQAGEEKVSAVKFLGSGCAISIASASLLTEAIKEKTVEEVSKIGEKEILKILGINLSPARLKCAFLPLDALKQALAKDGTKKTQ